MHTIEAYWYIWGIATIACMAIAFGRQLSAMNRGQFSGMGLTFIFAGGGYIFAILTVISIILNIITFAKA